MIAFITYDLDNILAYPSKSISLKFILIISSKKIMNWEQLESDTEFRNISKFENDIFKYVAGGD